MGCSSSAKAGIAKGATPIAAAEKIRMHAPVDGIRETALDATLIATVFIVASKFLFSYSRFHCLISVL
jgi:hypothetical protein